MFDWWKRKGRPESTERADALVERFLAALRTRETSEADAAELLGEIDAAEDGVRRDFLRALLRERPKAAAQRRKVIAKHGWARYDEPASHAVLAIDQRLHTSLATNFVWERRDFAALIEWWRGVESDGLSYLSVSKLLLRYFEKQDALGEEVVRAWIREAVAVENKRQKPDFAWTKRALELIGDTPALALVEGEPWSDALVAELDSMPDELRAAWTDLLLHAAAGTGSEPTKRWSARAREHLEPVGADELLARFTAWAALVDQPRTRRVSFNQYQTYDVGTLELTDPGQDVLKGLSWMAGLLGDVRAVRVLVKLALTSYRKIPGKGPRAVKVGNAAVHALGCIPGPDALGQLAMLRVRVKFGGATKAIDKALASSADRAGLSRDEIEELAVPSYGFQSVGSRRETLGDVAAELTLDVSGRTTLLFTKPNGKPTKTVPAAIKATHATEIAALKLAAKDAATMLSAQRARIDALFLEGKSWPLPTWRERYLDHPVVGVVARALIWTIEEATGRTRSLAFQSGGGFVDARGNAAAPVEAGARVCLWHPIEASVDEVLAWRRYFEERGARQPFKQAHREVYLLTDAERGTHTYSNRFAAHVLRQHAFHALCAARGWINKLRLLVDQEYPPATRRLPRHGLRAEFWIEGAGEEYGRDTNESGAFHYLTTDQVRFYRIDAAANLAHAGGGGYAQERSATGEAQPAALETIPALVLSEVLRDIDLFVGVASVASNPQWQDGGPENRFREYWWSVGFGDLSATGAGRRELLERLVPRLAIAPVCRFEDRFLVVTGKLRTYKIHLGSGNVLMEPNDQYLCIVPRASSIGEHAGALHLPFEGDSVLSIILSKAILLAADDEIRDETITRQIGR